MPIGKKVVVIGGSLVGVELAHFLAKRKRQVTVLESTSVMATQMAHPRRWRTLHEAELSGVNFYNEIQVIEINNDSVIWSKEGKESKTSADSIILTDGIESDLSLIEEFSSLNIEMHIIGDADYVGYIEGAIRSGNQIGSTI